MAADQVFKLTYATMFNPPEELHTRYDQALAKVKSELGRDHGMLIDGKEVFAEEKFDNRSPANTDVLLGTFQKGNAEHAKAALAAARKAARGWAHTPWQERVFLLRKAAALMDRRTFEMGVVLSLEVGKNRMEDFVNSAEDLLQHTRRGSRLHLVGVS